MARFLYEQRGDRIVVLAPACSSYDADGRAQRSEPLAGAPEQSVSSERKAESRGEDGEVVDIHDTVIVEVALPERAIRLTEIGGEDREIVDVDERIEVRIAGQRVTPDDR